MQTGDIIDCRDEQGNWYQSFVRFVYPKDSNNAGKCVAHFIGWNVKWDCTLDLYDDDVVAKRYSHARGPHRPKKKKQTKFFGQ